MTSQKACCRTGCDVFLFAALSWGLIERKQNEDAASLRVTSEVSMPLPGAMADDHGAIMECPGNRDILV